MARFACIAMLVGLGVTLGAWWTVPPVCCAADPPTELHRDAEHDARAAKLARQHARRGDAVAAFRTLGSIADPRTLSAAIADVAQASQPSDRAAGSGSADQPREVAAEARGGSIVNFGPLIELIQTTIAPEFWEATAGGPGTIFPYTGGILVAPDGLVFERPADRDDDDLLDNIAVMLARDHRPQADFASAGQGLATWKLPADWRCVSLSGLANEFARRRLTGQAIDEELRHLAGLSRVRYLVFDRQRRDVVLVGTVGGVESHQGWLRDCRTGAAVIRADHLAACLIAVISRQPLGCSIDPADDALPAAATVSSAIRQSQIPHSEAATALRQALGDQNIRIFGVPGDSPLAHLMVDADRHMKRLALGLEAMPTGVDNYLDVVTKHIRKGPPDGQLLRLWFAGQATSARQSADGQTIELAGRAIRLQSGTELAGARGERTATADDVRLVQFVDGFNRNFDDIARQYPFYAALETVFHTATITELIHRGPGQADLNQWLGPLLLDDPSQGTLHAPRRVPSIAIGHTIRHANKSHFVVLASGGVLIDPAELVAGPIETSSSLDNWSSRMSPDASAAQHWWWDIRRSR